MGLGAYRASSEQYRRHARHARHLRSEHGDAALRRPDRHRRPLRRPRDRQPETLRLATRARSSTSTSTRRRFPSASRSTFPSSATSRTCWSNSWPSSMRPKPSPTSPAVKDWWKQIQEWRGRDCLKYPDLGPGHQAAVGGAESLGHHQGRRLHHLRRRPAPDVGRAILRLRQAAPLDQFRRPGHDGRGPAVRHGRADGQPGRHRRLHHRRRLDPDVHPGTRHLQAISSDAEDHHAQQPLPRHGAPVAADRLRLALFRVLHGFAARLREAGRGLRPRRHEASKNRATSTARCAKPSP